MYYGSCCADGGPHHTGQGGPRWSWVWAGVSEETPPPLRNSPHRSWPRTKPVASPRRALWLTHPGSQPPPRPGTGDTKEKPGLAELEYDQIDTKVMFILLQGEGSSEESVIGHGEQGCAGETRTLW